eukprot:363353-Chlamydomonas_euryale.AAC.3
MHTYAHAHEYMCPCVCTRASAPAHTCAWPTLTLSSAVASAWPESANMFCSSSRRMSSSCSCFRSLSFASTMDLCRLTGSTFDCDCGQLRVRAQQSHSGGRAALACATLSRTTARHRTSAFHDEK